MKSTLAAITVATSAIIGSNVSAATITRKRTPYLQKHNQQNHNTKTNKAATNTILINSDEAYDPFLGLQQRNLEDVEPSEPSVPTYAPTDGSRYVTYAPTDDPATPAPVPVEAATPVPSVNEDVTTYNPVAASPVATLIDEGKVEVNIILYPELSMPNKVDTDSNIDDSTPREEPKTDTGGGGGSGGELQFTEVETEEIDNSCNGASSSIVAAVVSISGLWMVV